MRHRTAHEPVHADAVERIDAPSPMMGGIVPKQPCALPRASNVEKKAKEAVKKTDDSAMDKSQLQDWKAPS